MSVTEMIKVLPTQPGRYLAAGAVCTHGLQRQCRHKTRRWLQRRCSKLSTKIFAKSFAGSSLLPSFWHPAGPAKLRCLSVFPRQDCHPRVHARCSPSDLWVHQRQGTCWRTLSTPPLPPGAALLGGCFSLVLFENTVLLLRNYLRIAPRAKTKQPSK